MILSGPQHVTKQRKVTIVGQKTTRNPRFLTKIIFLFVTFDRNNVFATFRICIKRISLIVFCKKNLWWLLLNQLSGFFCIKFYIAI